MAPKVSIVMSSYNKAPSLRRVLKSIFRQTPNFEWELIFVDDGSTDNTREICAEFKDKPNFIYCYHPKNGYANPGPGRNIGYSLATGEILICQSSDVVHLAPATIQILGDSTPNNGFVIASVFNVDEDGFAGGSWPNGQLTGVWNQRPFFFLGSITRENMIRVGGDDIEFNEPSWEDDWLAYCLINGLGLTFNITEKVIGLHIDHPRPENLWDSHWRMKAVFEQKVKRAEIDRGEYFKNCLLPVEEARKFIVKL